MDTAHEFAVFDDTTAGSRVGFGKAESSSLGGEDNGVSIDMGALHFLLGFDLG